jgi:geranylgeranyl pyrophosphate synthase
LTHSPSFLSFIHNDLFAVENLMRAQADGYHPDIGSALQLLLSSGGKRLRPAITLLIGRMLNAPTDKLIIIAAAIELLHTATLVHDDLIDGSLLRRGMPTLNSQWSPGATVLTGDFLFSRAAKLAAETESVPVIKLFADTLTVIVNGEITQLFTSRCNLDRVNYFTRIHAKTASLIETSAKSAALISNASNDEIKCMQTFGYEVGMAFQIVDDILDFTSDEATLGKPVGSDLRQGLVTLPSILYAENNSEDSDIRFLIQGNCLNGEEQVQRLIQAIRNSPVIDQSFQEAKFFVERSLDCLTLFPDCPEKRALEELASYIAQRNQ